MFVEHKEHTSLIKATRLPFIYLVQEVSGIRFAEHSEQDIARPVGNTVEARFNKVLDISNDIRCPGQSYSKMYGIEPRYNEFFDITNSSI